jgi:hypothetical protein
MALRLGDEPADALPPVFAPVYRDADPNLDLRPGHDTSMERHRGWVRLAGRAVPINRVAGFRVLANRDRAVGPP